MEMLCYCMIITKLSIDEDPHFLAVASKLAASLHRTVFSDQVVYGREEQAELLGLLEEHITSNVVKVSPSQSIIQCTDKALDGGSILQTTSWYPTRLRSLYDIMWVLLW